MGANPIKGEVAFEAGGTRYKFVFGTYARAMLQRKLGQAPAQFFNARAEGEWGEDDILSVFYCGLSRHHDISEKEAADIMDEISLVKVAEIIREAVALASPDGEVAKEGTARPQRATKSRTG